MGAIDAVSYGRQTSGKFQSMLAPTVTGHEIAAVVRLPRGPHAVVSPGGEPLKR